MMPRTGHPQSAGTAGMCGPCGGGQLTRDGFASALWLDLVAAAAACTLVPVTIRRPLPGGLALSALMVLSHVVTPAATFAALNTARQRPLRPALLVAAAGVTGHAVAGWWRPAAGLPYRWWLLLVLMDIRMPRVNGITATARRAHPPEVIMLTTFDTDEHVVRALRAGAVGFLLKDTPPERIAAAMRSVAAGEPILSPAVTRRLMQRVAAGADAYEQARTALSTLSPRERDVALALARGDTNAQIAATLAMSVATVKTHITHILTKLDLNNRTQVAMLAHDAGLL